MDFHFLVGILLSFFHYWVGPVPYLELFWSGPVKKDTLYFVFWIVFFCYWFFVLAKNCNYNHKRCTQIDFIVIEPACVRGQLIRAITSVTIIFLRLYKTMVAGNPEQKVATNLGRKMTSSPELQQHLDVIVAAQRRLIKGVKRAGG